MVVPSRRTKAREGAGVGGGRQVGKTVAPTMQELRNHPPSEVEIRLPWEPSRLRILRKEAILGVAPCARPTFIVDEDPFRPRRIDRLAEVGNVGPDKGSVVRYIHHVQPTVSRERKVFGSLPLQHLCSLIGDELLRQQRGIERHFRHAIPSTEATHVWTVQQTFPALCRRSIA